MPAPTIKKYLDNHHVPYTSMKHPTAYTAQEIAHAMHIPGQNLAKTVMVKVDGKLAMAVLPATAMVDLFLLQEATHARSVGLAREEEFEGAFPDCEPGAMPPFGNLYHMDVYVAEKLARDKEIYFNGGSHSEAIGMKFTDFDNLVHPRIFTLAQA